MDCLQGTLQKFLDDLFQAVLSIPSEKPPLAVKYFFDFLEEQADKRGITDPDTLHIWKTNRYRDRSFTCKMFAVLYRFVIWVFHQLIYSELIATPTHTHSICNLPFFNFLFAAYASASFCFLVHRICANVLSA